MAYYYSWGSIDFWPGAPAQSAPWPELPRNDWDRFGDSFEVTHDELRRKGITLGLVLTDRDPYDAARDAYIVAEPICNIVVAVNPDSAEVVVYADQTLWETHDGLFSSIISQTKRTGSRGQTIATMESLLHRLEGELFHGPER